MGILGLSRLIADIAPDAIKEIEFKSLFGRRIAIDASMCIYQFLIAIRTNEFMMTNEQGETTSHLVGLFYRTIKLLENGIKPVYVFDGKAPKLKCGELEKRSERRAEAKDKLEEAKELQNLEEIQKMNKRLVKVTRKHVEDCKKLLELMGIPIVQAPSEAEAQCTQLCKENLVYAVATEDMDALTFGCPRLIRNLTHNSNDKDKLKEYQIEKVLNGLNLTQDQFIDLSILMGCDYCTNIKGIGGKKGLDLIKKFENIEGILKNKFGIENFIDVEIEYNNRRIDNKKEENENEEKEEEKSIDSGEKTNGIEDVKMEEETMDGLKKEEDEEESQMNPKNEDSDYHEEEEEQESDPNETSFDETINDKVNGAGKNPKKKQKSNSSNSSYKIPENWPFKGARKLFQQPLVLPSGTITELDLKPKDIDEEGMIQFLCIENGFNEERIRKSLKRAKDCKNKQTQTRIDSFFKILPSASSSSPQKRPQADSSKKNNKPTGGSSSGAKRGRPRR